MKIQLPLRFEKLEQLDKRYYKLAVGALVIVIALMGLVAYVAFLVSLRGEEQTLVPDVIGLPLEQALLKLQAKELYPRIALRATNDPADEGLVIVQDPQAGAVVKAGRRISLDVSRGAIVSTVAKYTGRDINSVTEELRRLFVDKRPLLVIRNVTYVFDKSQAGTILEQDPVPGADVAGVVPLSFWVSQGPEKAEAKVPQLVGLSIADALKKIEVLGLSFSFELRAAEGREAPGTVVSTKPASGKVIALSERITLVATRHKSEEGRASGLFSYELPTYPIPIPIVVEAIYPNGEEVQLLSLRHRGGDLSVPYFVPTGTVIVLEVNREETTRFEVKGE